MVANTDPIYSAAPAVGWSSAYIVTANTTADLTSGSIYLLFTAGSNGSFVQKVRLHATPAGNTTGTVLRLWMNNGGATSSSSNNILFDEITLPATTASGTAATPDYEIPVNFGLPASYTLYATIHTGSANGWAASVVGGNY